MLYFFVYSITYTCIVYISIVRFMVWKKKFGRTTHSNPRSVTGPSRCLALTQNPTATRRPCARAAPASSEPARS